MDQKPTDRAATARANDDRDLIDRMAEEAGGAGEASRSGGRTPTEIASRDEVNRALHPDGPRTSATKADDIQPATNSRSDHEGAQSD